MKQRDLETRDRLLKASAQLFAERGFKKVTVRDICRAARANVAAVNYHFGDKTGLYREVLQLAIETMRATNDAAREAGAGLPPDERLRQYIATSLCRAMNPGNGGGWISRLVHRELSDPTPSFDAIVDQALRPRVDDLTAIVAALLGCGEDDPRVPQSVASIHAQWMFFVPNPVAARVRARLQMRTDDAMTLAEHITTFSLAGIRALAVPPR
ncbi:MAG TPA: CerR family C-terminal domain-containing protein [Vicinamibacterales bacterium]|nr:CerR family C-terminal domain-containing protein [Vicinamibacterales bacterium]